MKNYKTVKFAVRLGSIFNWTPCIITSCLRVDTYSVYRVLERERTKIETSNKNHRHSNAF